MKRFPYVGALLVLIASPAVLQRAEGQTAAGRAQPGGGPDQNRAMLIRTASGLSTTGSSLALRPLQNRRRGDQNQKSAHIRETLHILQPIARSMICSRMFITGSLPVLTQ